MEDNDLVIKRSSTYGYVDFFEDEKEDEKISFCKHCEEFGFMVPLKNRLYEENEPIPVDHDQWKQCHSCGTIYPIYELQKESKIKDAIETTTDPFDISKNEFAGIDSRKTARKRRKQGDSEKEYDYIKEQDLKSELRKGSTLLSYSEQVP